MSCDDRDLLISLNERFTALTTKLYEFIDAMKESSAETRAENIRRDEITRAEINNVKHQHAEDLAVVKQEYTSLISDLHDDYKLEIKSLNETSFMLKGAVVLIYLMGIIATIFSAWNKFGT